MPLAASGDELATEAEAEGLPDALALLLPPPLTWALPKTPPAMLAGVPLLELALAALWYAAIVLPPDLR
jgi:hypothetical protein